MSTDHRGPFAPTTVSGRRSTVENQATSVAVSTVCRRQGGIVSGHSQMSSLMMVLCGGTFNRQRCSEFSAWSPV